MDMDTQGLPGWVQPIATIFVALSVVTALAVAYDIYGRGYRQRSVAVEGVWIISALWLGPFAIQPVGNCGGVNQIFTLRPEQIRHQRKLVVLAHQRPGELQATTLEFFDPLHTAPIFCPATLLGQKAIRQAGLTTTERELECVGRKLGTPDQPVARCLSHAGLFSLPHCWQAG